MFLPYVYIVKNRNTGKFYIGMRSANKVYAEQDLGTHYFTSSKHVKNNFSEYDIEIKGYFIDQLAAFEFENELIKEHWGNPLLLNRHYQKCMSKFSMTGAKRSDLAEYNRKTKSKPKEKRTYKCINCEKDLVSYEFCHHAPKKNYYCNATCKNQYIAKHRPSQAGRKINRVSPAWNKGLQNPQASLNGKKGAMKLSAKVKGRKRLYKEDGTWTWEYPATSVTEQAGSISES